MPENWKTYKLTDLGTIARGKSKHRPRDASHLYGGKYPFIQTGDVKAANHRLNKHTQTYSEAGLAQSKLWPKNTMCITIAANIAETAILNYPACFPDSIIGFVADEDKSDIEFVEYLMQFFKKQIQTHSIGSVQDNINLGTFQRVEFSVPPLEEQKSIASILSALDDKIELNLQMNKTLEEMAMALYKHWFVDFGPFQDGEFVNSELGEIPKGWEVKTIGELYNTTSGGTPSRKKPEYYIDGDINWVKSKELYGDFIIDTEEKINHLGLNKSSAKLIPPKSVLLAMYGATVGESSILSVEATCNQAICAIIEKELSFVYVFLFLRIFKTDILNQATGSAQQNISQQIIKNISIVSPPVGLKVFNQLEQYYALIEQNVFENKSLTQLRDTLLPKLISGEVRVKVVEKTLTEVL